MGGRIQAKKYKVISNKMKEILVSLIRLKQMVLIKKFLLNWKFKKTSDRHPKRIESLIYKQKT